MLLGAAASLSYGLWGLLEKLSTNQSPVVVNLIVYGTALAISLIGLPQFRQPSLSAVIGGVAGGAINGLILVLLKHHALTLVYPFVSCGSLVFIILSFFFLDGRIVARSRAALWAGVAISITGLLVCGAEIAGGISRLRTAAADLTAIYIAALISILTGLWLFLAFFTVTRQGYKPAITAIWMFFGSFSAALAVAVITNATPSVPLISRSTALATAAGLFMYGGELLTYHGFAAAPALTNRAEHIITAVLANSELAPIILLSGVFVGDLSLMGTLGCVLVIIGIGTMNHARA